MHTADDDSVPVPTDALYLPRPVLMRAAVWRPQRDELEPEDTDITSVDSLSGSPASTRTASDDFDDEPTRAIQTFVPPPLLPRTRELPRTPERPDALPVLLARGPARFDDLLARGTAHLDTALARAAQLWRDGPLRTAAMVAGAALITYLAVGGARRGGEQGTQMVLVPAAAPPAAAPIIVEQLNEARQPLEVAAPLRGEQSDRPARSSSSSRTRATSNETAPTSKSLGYQVIAPAQVKPKSSRTERPSTTVSSSSSGLPAWGSETVRDFSGGKSSAGASVSSHSQALTAKPSSSNVEARGSAREQDQTTPAVAAKPAPVVAAKPVEPEPVEPPKPVEPPAPKKPLTMDQVLNQVEEAAQAQRKKEGLKAPKPSKRDEELDALISGAMKSKGK